MDFLSIDFSNPQPSFERIANELMNNWVLWSNGIPYRIAELEFYVNGATHGDTYTHGHKLQRTAGKWYMHGSGMDLTCGDEHNHGGILIRALQDLSDDKNYHYGPITCVAKLFEKLDSALLHSFEFGLAKDKDGLIKREVQMKPIAAPRVGLNPTKNVEMFSQLYRFLVLPKKRHADKTAIEKAMRANGNYSESEIKAIWG